MNRTPVAVGALVLLMAACGSSDAGNAPPRTTASPGTTPSATTTSPGGIITIADFDFGMPITVAAGDTVTIRNTDGVTHTWTATEGTFDSGPIEGGSAAMVTLATPGEYSVVCQIHASMTGTITVTGDAGAAPGSATTTTTPSASPPPIAPAEVVFEDQASNGASVTVASVTLPAPGFVVVHGDAAGTPGPVVGHSDLLPAGSSTNVVVFLDSRLLESATVFLMAHIDVNGNGDFEFAPPATTTDAPATTSAGAVAVTSGVITVEIDY